MRKQTVVTLIQASSSHQPAAHLHLQQVPLPAELAEVMQMLLPLQLLPAVLLVRPLQCWLLEENMVLEWLLQVLPLRLA